MNTALPFTKEKIEGIVKEFPTPFHIYDERGIRGTARGLNSAFSWVPGKGYQNYFAVKATPNPTILSILKEERMGADCSSSPELTISERVGLTGEDVMFTSNDTPAEEFQKAKQMSAIINLDDITHLEFLEQHSGLPDLICFRYNPGPLREGNRFIGDPKEQKYGLTTEQIVKAYRLAKEKGVKRFGLHTMIVSNMLKESYLIDTGKMLFNLVNEISDKVGIDFDFVNLGGGIGTPYRPEEEPVDLNQFSLGIKELYDKQSLSPLRIVTESGRAITGPHGFLISKVRHVTKKYRDYVGLDACMANLMGPALYGAYHHITVLGKETKPHDQIYDVTGSLCENNDKFAVQRSLPKIERGDLVVIHNAGAHGHAMGFSYNGKLRSAELLLQEDGNVRMIRRAETEADYFRTVEDFFPD